MQLDIFNAAQSALGAKNFQLENGALVYYPGFYPKQVADELYTTLIDETIWKQESIKIYGRSVLYPRLTAWYGDNLTAYQFSGTKFFPHPWTETLLKIKNDISRVEHAHLNSVLLNLYRNGNDSVSWHTDAELELGKDPVIVSVNFGADRRFMLRRIDNHAVKINILLEHGSLLVMGGELQHYWQHQIPKSTKVTSPRINLTFRHIYSN
jgi:alkylated DNA repair dioxygenase AlkB